MYTILLILLIVGFVVWLAGILTKGLPGELVTAALAIWIICGALLLAFTLVGKPHFAGRWW
jgi:hypothetical protein